LRLEYGNGAITIESHAKLAPAGWPAGALPKPARLIDEPVWPGPLRPGRRPNHPGKSPPAASTGDLPADRRGRSRRPRQRTDHPHRDQAIRVSRNEPELASLRTTPYACRRPAMATWWGAGLLRPGMRLRRGRGRPAPWSARSANWFPNALTKTYRCRSVARSRLRLPASARVHFVRFVRSSFLILIGRFATLDP
jgi:hypothetical protein